MFKRTTSQEVQEQVIFYLTLHFHHRNDSAVREEAVRATLILSPPKNLCLRHCVLAGLAVRVLVSQPEMFWLRARIARIKAGRLTGVFAKWQAVFVKDVTGRYEGRK